MEAESSFDCLEEEASDENIAQIIQGLTNSKSALEKIKDFELQPEKTLNSIENLLIDI